MVKPFKYWDTTLSPFILNSDFLIFPLLIECTYAYW
jgi:hypothetical protein